MAQTLTPQEQDQRVLEWGRLRDRARQDLFFLANEILSPPESRIMVHHAHDIIVNHCQKFFGWKEFFAIDKQGHFIIHSKTGMPIPTLQQPRVKMWDLPGSRDNLLLVSRGHLKTTIHTVAHIIQWIINYPDVRILMCTATDEKAQIIVGKTKQHFQYNPRFRHLFPEFCPPKSKISDWGSKTEFSVPNRTRNDEPTLMTAAVGKALASTHHDVIKASDVVTENNIRTEGQLMEVKDFFGYLEPLRERGESKDGKPNPGWKDVEGTLYSNADYYQMILDNNATGAWKITRQSCWINKEKTASLWPERFPVEELRRIEASPEVGPVKFASQYELEAVRAEDGLASEDEIAWFDGHIAQQLMPRYRLFTAIDAASPIPSAHGDFWAFATAGIDNDARVDVLSLKVGKFTNDEAVDLIFAIDKIYEGRMKFNIQKDHFAHALEPLIKRRMSKEGRYINFELTPISTRESKAAKIKSLQGFFRLGLIRFTKDIAHKAALVRQITRWPGVENDDILDVISDLFRTAKGVTSAMYADAPKYSMDDLINASGRQRFAGPQFQGFDPISQEARWLHDVIEGAHSAYDSVTGV